MHLAIALLARVEHTKLPSKCLLFGTDADKALENCAVFRPPKLQLVMACRIQAIEIPQVRGAVLECAGVENILTKCIGSNNPHNVLKATMDAIDRLQTPSAYLRRRGAPEAAVEAAK